MVLRPLWRMVPQSVKRTLRDAGPRVFLGACNQDAGYKDSLERELA